MQQLLDRQNAFVKEEKMSLIIPLSASPLSEFTGENIQLVRQVISNDPHSIYDEIKAETSLSLS